MTIRRPRLKPQMIDPTTTLDPYLCTMESGAMGLDILTGGAIDVWGGNLVPYCGRTASEIRRKGTNLNNVANAWRHWGKTLDIRTGNSFTAAINDLRAGYWLIMQGDYDRFTISTRCQDSFLGDHAIIVGPEFTSTSVLMGDPLCREWKYVTINELKNYAQKLGQRIYTQVFHSWSGQIFYARIKPKIALPDTSTGGRSMAAYKSTLVKRTNYRVRVKGGARHAAVQLYDGEFIWLNAGDIKDSYAQIRIDPPIPGGAPGANRRDGYLVGAEEAILLLSDASPIL